MSDLQLLRLDPDVSQYVIGVDIPRPRPTKAKAVLGFTFGFATMTGLDLWLFPGHPLEAVVRGLVLGLAMCLSTISKGQGPTEVLLVVTNDYVEQKRLSSIGTTIESTKIHWSKIKGVSEVRRPLGRFPFRLRRGLLIKKAALGHSIFVPETAPDYAAIKARLMAERW